MIPGATGYGRSKTAGLCKREKSPALGTRWNPACSHQAAWKTGPKNIVGSKRRLPSYREIPMSVVKSSKRMKKAVQKVTVPQAQAPVTLPQKNNGNGLRYRFVIAGCQLSTCLHHSPMSLDARGLYSICAQRQATELGLRRRLNPIRPLRRSRTQPRDPSDVDVSPNTNGLRLAHLRYASAARVIREALATTRTKFLFGTSRASEWTVPRSPPYDLFKFGPARLMW